MSGKLLLHIHILTAVVATILSMHGSATEVPTKCKTPFRIAAAIAPIALEISPSLCCHLSPQPPPSPPPPGRIACIARIALSTCPPVPLGITRIALATCPRYII